MGGSTINGSGRRPGAVEVRSDRRELTETSKRKQEQKLEPKYEYAGVRWPAGPAKGTGDIKLGGSADASPRDFTTAADTQLRRRMGNIGAAYERTLQLFPSVEGRVVDGTVDGNGKVTAVRFDTVGLKGSERGKADLLSNLRQLVYKNPKHPLRFPASPTGGTFTAVHVFSKSL